MAVKIYKLPDLPYSLDALEPIISAQIMDLHYNKHHNTYVTNLNNALKSQSEAVTSNDLIKQLELQAVIKFNAGGHVNHTLFWENLQSPSTSQSRDTTAAAPKLLAAINSKYGSLEKFIDVFTAIALSLQGSGWVWLVKSATPNAQGLSDLSIVTTKDQDIVPSGLLPVFGVDMWEHAYYLRYLNNKKGYIDGVWQVINWTVAEKRFVGVDGGVIYGTLAGLVGKI